MKEKKLYLILGIILAVALILIFAIWGANHTTPDVGGEPVPIVKPDTTVVVHEVEKFVEVEKTFSSQIIRDGLRDMGLMITEEYYFTEVMSYSSVKKLFNNIDLPFTESSYLASYDGVVAAGVDFNGIEVTKDEETKLLCVTVPKAEIQYVTVDTDSFKLYSEKTGLGNPISLADYNTSLSELQNNARNKAVEKGVLTRADENAEILIRNFVVSLVGADAYEITVNVG